MIATLEARIPVRFRHDGELGTWHFQVADPIVVGGGQRTLEEAKRAAAEAIAFALEAEAEPDGGRIEYLTATVG
ncbi:MAG TPA: hypothetical protein VFD01_08500 [Candidatus Dormibacteraeota bacterium]|jgi:predicted RNase H-like HicB family nuclease|nr:hypothetical protein [Candidatus Dormibacteraeota bacterium]